MRQPGNEVHVRDIVMLKAGIMLGAALVACVAAQASAAAEFDGKSPFTCAPIDIVSCSPGKAGGQCEKETTEGLNFPRFLKFDVPRNEVTGTRPDGKALSAVIASTRHDEGNMMLEGVEGSIIWSVVIAEETGDMTITGAGPRIGFVAFGGCTSL
jgi:hypothetical protein